MTETQIPSRSAAELAERYLALWNEPDADRRRCDTDDPGLRSQAHSQVACHYAERSDLVLETVSAGSPRTSPTDGTTSPGALPDHQRED